MTSLMNTKYAARASIAVLLAVLGLTGGMPLAASAHYSSRSSYSSFDSSGRIRYDSNGTAYYESSSSRRDDTWDDYRNDWGNGNHDDRSACHSSGSHASDLSTAGRIRYTSSGVAYWSYVSTPSTSCR